MRRKRDDQIAQTTTVPALSTSEGREPGFDELFNEYRPLVYGVGLRLLGRREDAEDATQEVFTKVWRSLDSFNRESSLKTWIYRIAINTCIDYGRRTRKKTEMPEVSVSEFRPDVPGVIELSSEETAERRLLEKERAAHLQRAILLLRPHLKDVFLLKEVEEMSYDEISLVLDLSIGTISSRLNRAKKALQESLEALVHRPALAEARA